MSRTASYESAYQAITEGDPGAVRELVAADPSLARATRDLPDWPTSTLLEHAVWWHREEIVECLVGAGASSHRPGGTPAQSPLGRALEMGADRLADLLGPATDLESAAGLGDAAGVESRLQGADAADRRRAFRLACLNGRRETARQLCPDGWFDNDALVDALLHGRHLLTWDGGEAAWDWAAFQLDLADPLNLLDFDSQDDAGRTLLDAARQSGHDATVRHIADRRPRSRRGVEPERAWRPVNTPLQERFLFACQWGQTSRVRAFLTDDPSLVHSRTMWDGGSLYLPGAYGSTGSVDALLDFYDEQTGCTPALAALTEGDRRLADAMIAAKPRMDINEAAAFGDVAALEALLDEYDITGPRAGAGPPHVPLHFAAWRGELAVAGLLLERGYSAGAMNRADEAGKYEGMPSLRGTTPLHVAAKAGQTAVLERLLDTWYDHWRPLP